MGFKWLKSKKNPTEDTDKVEVEFDLLTGGSRVDPRKFLSSKATRDMLENLKGVEDRIMQGQDR